MNENPTHYQFSFYCEVYPVDIHVCYSNNQDKIEKYFKYKTTEPKLERYGNMEVSARTSRYKNHILIEIKPEAARHANQFAGLIAHEAVHATWMIEKELGDLFDANIQEPQCYLVQYITQYITRKVWTFINKNNKLYKELKKRKKS
jgi:hypothetical protein